MREEVVVVVVVAVVVVVEVALVSACFWALTGGNSWAWREHQRT